MKHSFGKSSDNENMWIYSREVAELHLPQRPQKRCFKDAALISIWLGKRRRKYPVWPSSLVAEKCLEHLNKVKCISADQQPASQPAGEAPPVFRHFKGDHDQDRVRWASQLVFTRRHWKFLCSSRVSKKILKWPRFNPEGKKRFKKLFFRCPHSPDIVGSTLRALKQTHDKFDTFLQQPYFTDARKVGRKFQDILMGTSSTTDSFCLGFGRVIKIFFLLQYKKNKSKAKNFLPINAKFPPLVTCLISSGPILGFWRWLLRKLLLVMQYRWNASEIRQTAMQFRHPQLQQQHLKNFSFYQLFKWFGKKERGNFLLWKSFRTWSLCIWNANSLEAVEK